MAQLILIFIMNLPNQHFQDYPVEFKKINSEDFPYFEVEEKVNLELNNGYIGDSFIENISIDESNTVVVNCGVGSGKTTAIIRAIKQFYENQEYVIFVASPFLSLVEQYYDDIQRKAEISEGDIYRHESIGEEHIDYTNKRVHIVTINALLGNPGEDSYINSIAKRRYLDGMVNYCESNNKKVIFIYDEIHDSIHNFKEKFVFNLWKWRNVIHKNFVISATYSEASKIVIEYLAELTHDKIKILEAERVRIPEKLSDLYLYYDNARSYSNENGNLISIVDSVIERDLDIDILCFSKKLCKSIISSKEEGVGKLLNDKYGEDINDCTSGLENNSRIDRDYIKGRYNENKCNIGTNFKSGVSIEKENHAFILIFPPITARGDFKSSYGIFSDGINNIIQALARKREKGEIHILLPRPTNFNYDSFPFNESQKEVFKHYFEPIQYQSTRPSLNDIVDRKTIDYIPLDNQNDILSNFYNNELKSNVEASISHINSVRDNRVDKVRLEFPEFKLFQLEDGEKYLANKYKFLGKDLSGYVSYSTAANQFVNCNLVYTNMNPIQNFKVDKLQFCFNKFYENYFDVDWFNSLRKQVTDTYVYHEIRNEIFDNYQVKMYGVDSAYMFVKPYESRVFETQLVAFIQRKLYPSNEEFKGRFKSSNGWVQDSEYTRGDYFRGCISHANRLNQLENLSGEVKPVVEAYLSLDYFRIKLLSSVQTRIIKSVEIKYIDKTPISNFFTREEMEVFESMCSIICENDSFIINEIFEFKRFLNSNETIEKKLNRFYKYLKQDMFELETKKIDGVDRDMILTEYPIYEPSKTLDFISPAIVTLPEENMTKIKVVDGVIKSY
ncbi:hypothetical protein GCM10022291_24860 [Postechiella marina]|uniref:Helicase/UvrB N-terminal domain-containing protein n=1 Tax=Postechiella marina TaxID=943941 RepID=A0ABP8CCX5_9FLAO